MKSRILIFLFVLIGAAASAQRYEVGGWVGGANYFGDLNANGGFSTIRPGGGAFLRMNFGTRWAIKYSASFARVMGDDARSTDQFDRQRNLSFRSNIAELAFLGEFNFLEYSKLKKEKWFSPYLTLGFAVFYYNPQAEFNGQWYFLQPLGTEGQNDPSYSGLEKYRLVSFAIPIGMGLKFSLTENWNIGLDVVNRITFTDYLDDVSGAYPSPLSLPDGRNGIAYQLYDRSAEVGERIGEEGYQRGSSEKRDDYLFLGLSVSYTFVRQKCPSPRGFD